MMTSPGGGKFWDCLARWFPWLGTPGLLKAVVLLNALTFLLITAAPDYAGVLSLDPARIMQGEIWRRSVFWIFFALLFLWFLATGLEEMWGPLRLNVFYLVGMIGCTLAAFFFGGGPSNTFLNLSLFFAFATIAPDYEVFLFFIARVKIKYIAWFMAAVFGLQFLVLPLPSKMAMAASLANYLLFFAPTFISDRRAHRRDRRAVRVAGSGDEFCREHLPAA